MPIAIEKGRRPHAAPGTCTRAEHGAHALELIGEHGLTLSKALEKAGLASSTFFDWVRTDSDFAAAYEQARIAQAHRMFDVMIEIADEHTYTMDQVQRNRLRVEARRLYASKAAPKLFGDKVQHEHQHQHAVVILPPLDPRPLPQAAPSVQSPSTATIPTPAQHRKDARRAIPGVVDSRSVDARVEVTHLTPEVQALPDASS